MSLMFENPMYYHIDRIHQIEVSGNHNDTSGDAKIDSDDVVFLCFYSIFAVIQTFFLVVILKDKALRQSHSNWFPLAAVIAMFINMILMMTALIGAKTSAPSWNNIIGLCYPLTIVQLASGNWPSAFLIVTIIGRTMRYKKGDPNAPAYPAKRAIINLISTTTIVTSLTCLVVFGFGRGHRISTTMATNATTKFGKDFCYVDANTPISIATTAFHTFMLLFMLTTSCCLVRAKVNHYIISGRRHLLDATTALLLIVAIWFFLNLPYIVIAGAAGDKITDINGPLYPHIRASRITYVTAYGWVPALWVWLDPDYRASGLRLFQSCFHCAPSPRKNSVGLINIEP